MQEPEPLLSSDFATTFDRILDEVFNESAACQRPKVIASLGSGNLRLLEYAASYIKQKACKSAPPNYIHVQVQYLLIVRNDSEIGDIANWGSLSRLSSLTIVAAAHWDVAKLTAKLSRGGIAIENALFICRHRPGGNSTGEGMADCSDTNAGSFEELLPFLAELAKQLKFGIVVEAHIFTSVEDYLGLAADCSLLSDRFNTTLGPGEAPNETVVLSYFQLKPYRLRRVTKHDIDALMKLTHHEGFSFKAVSPEVLQSLIDNFSPNNYLLEVDGQICSAVFTQRLSESTAFTIRHLSELKQIDGGSLMNIAILLYEPRSHNMGHCSDLVNYLLEMAEIDETVSSAIVYASLSQMGRDQFQISSEFVDFHNINYGALCGAISQADPIAIFEYDLQHSMETAIKRNYTKGLKIHLEQRSGSPPLIPQTESGLVCPVIQIDRSEVQLTCPEGHPAKEKAIIEVQATEETAGSAAVHSQIEGITADFGAAAADKALPEPPVSIVEEHLLCTDGDGEKKRSYVEEWVQASAWSEECGPLSPQLIPPTRKLSPMMLTRSPAESKKSSVVSFGSIPESYSDMRRKHSQTTFANQILLNIRESLDDASDELSVDQSLFSLGYDSEQLMALKLTLEQKLRVILPSSVFYTHDTPNRLAEYIAVELRITDMPASTSESETGPSDSQTSTRKSSLWSLHVDDNCLLLELEAKINFTEPLELSPSQARMWFTHSSYANQSHLLVLPFVLRIAKRYQFSAFELAVLHLCQQQESLRTVFHVDNEGTTRQAVIGSTSAFQLARTRALSCNKLNDAMNINYNFDLNSTTVAACWSSLTNTTAEESHILLSVHHILYDGWSSSVMMTNLNQILAKVSSRQEPSHYDRLSFLESIGSQNDAEISKQISYWVDSLRTAETLQLPADRQAGAMAYNREKQLFSMNREMVARLKTCMKAAGSTAYSVIAAALGSVLGLLCGQDDIVFGCPVSGRDSHKQMPIIGCYINTVLMRIQLKQTTHLEYLRAVRTAVVSSLNNQSAPFQNVVNEVVTHSDLDRTKICRVLLNQWQSNAMPAESVLQSTDLDVRNTGVVGIDLSISILQSGETMSGIIEFNSAHFYAKTVLKMYQLLRAVISSFYATFHNEVHLFDQCLSGNNISQVDPQNWHKFPASLLHHHPQISIIAKQAMKEQNSVAVLHDGREVTFQQLNELSSNCSKMMLQRCLQSGLQGRVQDTPIPICMPRSIDILIGILSIHYSGFAYVPMDPEYPAQRLAYCLGNINAFSCLGHINPDCCAELGRKIASMQLDDLLSTQPYLERRIRRDRQLPLDLSNMIYTSGSTGLPKGVCIDHRSVVSSVLDTTIRMPCINAQYSIYQSFNYIFDVSVMDMGLGFYHGAYLVLAVDKLQVSKEVVEFRIMQANLVAALINNLTSDQLKCMRSVENISTCGENVQHSSLFQVLSGGLPTYNMYGPSETTIFSTGHSMKVLHNNANIGRALTHETAYSMNESFQQTPSGMAGQLYIGGHSLARGYLKRLELSQEKFSNSTMIPSELRAKNLETRLYATGDFVKFVSDGTIEYIGRRDFQVKLSGFRIELSEIENVVLDIKNVKQCNVLVISGSWGDTLVAFCALAVKPQDEADFTRECSDYVASKVPHYMVPTAFVFLAKIPTSYTGKADRNEMKKQFLKWREGPRAPQEAAKEAELIDDLEARLLQVWKNLLPIANFGINDSFFDVGGNSILALRLKHVYESELKLGTIEITDIFQYVTIQKFAEHVKELADVTDTVSMPEIYVDHVIRAQQELEYDSDRHEIAILSVVGQFSGCNSVERYWKNLLRGNECLEILSKFDLNFVENVTEEMKHENYIASIGKLDDVQYFDHQFWNLSHNDAKIMGPQIRMFLQTCWHAIETAGVINQRQNINCGVFAGFGHNNYFDDYVDTANLSDHKLWAASQLNDAHVLTTRASYLLNILGPSMTISTACSTSLVALIEACRNLKLAACDTALAGAVSFPLPEKLGYIYEPGMIFAADGHCRVFDRSSSGTVLGAGCAVALLKPRVLLDESTDMPCAIITGYGINNDGQRKMGYTAPSIAGQAACVQDALKSAGISASQLSYIECHGTGTKIGDPIEIAALNEVFSKSRGRKSVTIGSVKANIGHADSASGMASVVKICKMLREKEIPPQINFEALNPLIKNDVVPFSISTEKRIWDSLKLPLTAGASSFGIGGTNAHVILQHPHDEDSIVDDKHSVHQISILPWSAKSATACVAYGTALQQHFETTADASLPAVSSYLINRRAKMDYRQSTSGAKSKEVITALDSVQKPFKFQKHSGKKQTVVFMFPGQGAQHLNMGRALKSKSSVFRNSLNACFQKLTRSSGIHLSRMVYTRRETIIKRALLNQTEWTQIALFAMSYSLGKQIEQFGIEPKAYTGHSAGQFVALTSTTELDELESMLLTIFHRARLMQSAPRGSMIAAQSDLLDVIDINKLGVDVAAINSPGTVTLSGRKASVEIVHQLSKRHRKSSKLLDTSHAFHSRSMEVILDPFKTVLFSTGIAKPRAAVISNLDGRFLSSEATTDPEYWTAHLACTVMFSQGIKTIAEQLEQPIYIEVGPGRALSRLVQSHTDVIKEHVLLTMHQSEDLYDAMGKLWMIDYPVNWRSLGICEQPVSEITERLPGYQFDKVYCWLDKPAYIRPVESFSKDKMFQSVWQKIPTVDSTHPEVKQNKSLQLLVISNAAVPVPDDKVQRLNKSLHSAMIIVENSNGSFVAKDARIRMNVCDEKHRESFCHHLEAINFQPTLCVYYNQPGVQNQPISGPVTAAFASLHCLLVEIHCKHLALCNSGICAFAGETGSSLTILDIQTSLALDDYKHLAFVDVDDIFRETNLLQVIRLTQAGTAEQRCFYAMQNRDIFHYRMSEITLGDSEKIVQDINSILAIGCQDEQHMKTVENIAKDMNANLTIILAEELNPATDYVCDFAAGGGKNIVLNKLPRVNKEPDLAVLFLNTAIVNRPFIESIASQIKPRRTILYKEGNHSNDHLTQNIALRCCGHLFKTSTVHQTLISLSDSGRASYDTSLAALKYLVNTESQIQLTIVEKTAKHEDSHEVAAAHLTSTDATTPMELEILMMFAEVLGDGSYGKSDNFFEIGGNSLNALQVCESLRQRFQCQIDVKLLYEYNSPAKISSFITLGAGNRTNIVAPLLINGATLPNLFMIHAAGGSAQQYQELVQMLPIEYNYIGISYPHMGDLDAGSDLTLVKLAQMYVDEVQKYQQSGPYYLCGHSFGGTMGYEMARQLTDLGHSAPYVIMIDTWAHFTPILHDPKRLREVQRKYFSEMMRERYALTEEEMPQQVINMVIETIVVLVKMLLTYNVRKTDIKVYQLRAVELDDLHDAHDPTSVNFENCFWQFYTSSPVSVFRLSGAHHTIMFDAEPLKQQADILKGILIDPNYLGNVEEHKPLTPIPPVIRLDSEACKPLTQKMSMLAYYHPDCSLISKIRQLMCDVIPQNELINANFDINDDFFDIGGTERSANELITKIGAIYKYTMELNELLEYNSATLIACFLAIGRHCKEFKILMPLSVVDTSLPNVIFIHSNMGLASVYMSLVNYLSESRLFNSIGINCPQEELQSAQTLKSLSSLLTVQLNEIVSLQSEGDYILVGHSLGAHIAYEHAVKLRAAGKSVVSLIMLNPWRRQTSGYHDAMSRKRTLSMNTRSMLQRRFLISEGNVPVLLIDDLNESELALQDLVKDHHQTASSDIDISMIVTRNHENLRQFWQDRTSKHVNLFVIEGDESSMLISEAMLNQISDIILDIFNKVRKNNKRLDVETVTKTWEC